MGVPLNDDVIIIDDDHGVLEVLELYCENLGCFRNIIKARDGSEASKKLENQKFALILLDINMPKKSGVDIIKELADKNHVNSLDSVVIVSGELNKTVLAESMKRGVKTFLVKPFDETQFIERVKGILAKVRPGLLP
jgi:response regulator of citrate/malate metabolism